MNTEEVKQYAEKLVNDRFPEAKDWIKIEIRNLPEYDMFKIRAHVTNSKEEILYGIEHAISMSDTLETWKLNVEYLIDHLVKIFKQKSS